MINASAQTITAACAVVILLASIVLYALVSAPINRQFTRAATSRQVPGKGRVLQSNWNRIINARAILQGLALAALCLTLSATSARTKQRQLSELAQGQRRQSASETCVGSVMCWVPMRGYATSVRC
jgi:hypothetical protein